MTLTSGNLSLCAPTFSDSEITFLSGLRNNPSIAHQLVNRANLSNDWQIKEWLKRKNENADEQAILLINLSKMEQKELIGYITYFIEDQTSKVANLGVCVSPANQGKGYGSLSLSLLMEYLVNVYAVRKFIYYALSSNIASRKTFARLGFNEVGNLRKHFLSHKVFCDIVIGEKLVDDLTI